MNLGEKIYQLRNEKNMSQGDLAERLDVSRQSVSKWENNTAVPDLDKLIKICDIFEISLDELTGREVPQAKPISKIEEIREIKNSLTKIQVVGCVLLGVGIICLLLPYGVFLAPSLIACGIVCMTVKKAPWYWCAWVVFIPLLFVIGWAMAINFICIIIEIAFLVVMAFVTYKAFKDTEIVMPKKKAILILVLSVAFDLIYILFRLWNLEAFGGSFFGAMYNAMDNVQGYSEKSVVADWVYAIINMVLLTGVGLSYIGIFLSAKNLRKK